MSEPLTYTYTPEQNDYAQVLRIFFLRQTGIRVSLAVLVLAFVYILFTIARQTVSVTIFEILWLLLPPIFVLYILFYQPRSMAKRAISTAQLAAEQTWVMDDEGVHITMNTPTYVEDENGEKVASDPTPTRLEWENLKQLISAKDYYLLVFKTEKNFFRFLPRRVFTSPDEQDKFLGMVSSHMPTSQAAPRP